MTVEENCTVTFGDFIKEFQILERQGIEEIIWHKTSRQSV